MVKIKGGVKMLKYLNFLMILSATVFMGIAESSINLMCHSFFDELELPEELK